MIVDYKIKKPETRLVKSVTGKHVYATYNKLLGFFMLSESTVKSLRKSCSISNQLYDQGGMKFSYEYHEGMNHTIAKVQENLYSTESMYKLSHFIEVATVSFESTEISVSTENIVNELVANFGKDFNGCKAYLKRYDENGAYSEITFLFVSTYGFHSLEFFWSLD